jgi:hypothetical protein
MDAIPFPHRKSFLPIILIIAPALSWAAPAFDFDTTYEVALEQNGQRLPSSIREHAITWHPLRQVYYLVADVVPLDSPHHPNTYDTSIHLWRSPDLTVWTYLGVAVPAGAEGEFDARGCASPTAMTYRDENLYVAYSARKTEKFAERGIGLAWSGSNPDNVPWTKSEGPVSDRPGEDDDPGVLTIPGDKRLHCYHRTTGGAAGYRIVHTASDTPRNPDSWGAAIDVTVRPDGIRAQELTGVAWLNNQVHLFIIEQGDAVRGAQIAHLVNAKPTGPFVQADPDQRHLTSHASRLAYGGHFTPVTREGTMVAGFWTAFQVAKRYGLRGHPVANQP